jgi:hypothetical protein
MTPPSSLQELNEKNLSRLILDRLMVPADLRGLYGKGEEPVDLLRTLRRELKESTAREAFDRAVVIGLRTLRTQSVHVGKAATEIESSALISYASLIQQEKIILTADEIERMAEHTRLFTPVALLDEQLERSVLGALATVQPPGKLTEHWKKLWRNGPPSLQPLATAGLRRSNAKAATDILPEIVQQARHDKDFPLGDILWAYAHDGSCEIGRIGVRDALEKLSLEDRAFAAKALKTVGAEPEEIAEITGWKILPSLTGSPGMK